MKRLLVISLLVLFLFGCKKEDQQNIIQVEIFSNIKLSEYDIRKVKKDDSKELVLQQKKPSFEYKYDDTSKKSLFYASERILSTDERSFILTFPPQKEIRSVEVRVNGKRFAHSYDGNTTSVSVIGFSGKID